MAERKGYKFISVHTDGDAESEKIASQPVAVDSEPIPQAAEYQVKGEETEPAFESMEQDYGKAGETSEERAARLHRENLMLKAEELERTQASISPTKVPLSGARVVIIVAGIACVIASALYISGLILL